MSGARDGKAAAVAKSPGTSNSGGDCSVGLLSVLRQYVLNVWLSVAAFYRQGGKMPIVVFYKYMWAKNKTLLAKTLVVNYAFQLVLEVLPWWASRRKVGNKLRSSRIKLNYSACGLVVPVLPFVDAHRPLSYSISC
jgi:hypothetical protein